MVNDNGVSPLDKAISDNVEEKRSKVLIWNETGRGTFQAIGKPEWYFVYRRLSSLPVKESMSLMRRVSSGLVGEQTSDNIMNELEKSLESFINLCIEWNIKDFTGEDFPLPKDDNKVWERIPTGLSTVIATFIRTDPNNLDDDFLERMETHSEHMNPN